MKFVLSDGTVVNSYGFRVRTSGIKFSRFEANPVMLAEHQNRINSVLGKWINLVVEGALVMAEAEFDEEDPDAAKVKGKVARGYIKGVSIGISFDGSKLELMPDGVWELTECELFEASICAIPSNSGSLRLYAVEDGKLLNEQDVKLSLSALLNNDFTKIPVMKKIELSVAALAALGLNEQPREDQIELLNSKIVELKKALGAEQTAREALENQAAAVKKDKSVKLVAAALSAGKIKADEQTSWMELAENNFDLAERTLGTLTGKATLADKVENTGEGEVKTEEDFQKLTLEKQLAFKSAHPEAYNKLFA